MNSRFKVINFTLYATVLNLSANKQAFFYQDKIL